MTKWLEVLRYQKEWKPLCHLLPRQSLTMHNGSIRNLSLVYLWQPCFPQFFELEIEDYAGSVAGRRVVTSDLRRNPVYDR